MTKTDAEKSKQIARVMSKLSHYAVKPHTRLEILAAAAKAVKQIKEIEKQK